MLRDFTYDREASTLSFSSWRPLSHDSLQRNSLNSFQCSVCFAICYPRTILLRTASRGLNCYMCLITVCFVENVTQSVVFLSPNWVKYWKKPASNSRECEKIIIRSVIAKMCKNLWAKINNGIIHKHKHFSFNESCVFIRVFTWVFT